MRQHPKKKIFRSLCKTHKCSDGSVNWAKVANEMRKLPYYGTLFKHAKPVCKTCGK